jgi:hypothetical protein
MDADGHGYVRHAWALSLNPRPSASIRGSGFPDTGTQRSYLESCPQRQPPISRSTSTSAVIHG